RDDLVVVDNGSSLLQVSYGTPEVGVTAGPSVFGGVDPAAAAAADFNGDGHADLAIANPVRPGPYAGFVMLRLGDGRGGFPGEVRSSPSPAPGQQAVADFDDDGRPDLAAIVSDTHVAVYRNRGDGTFENGSVLQVGSMPVALAVADLDGEAPGWDTA
ncbi:MAG: FG-GAP repeat domain-containing protein, partial [Gemmatimonadales bacterium]